jgi:hypothetical protein
LYWYRWIAWDQSPPRSPRSGNRSNAGAALFPADGFYEWSQNGKSKQPYCFELHERQPFAFAGLWDRWRARDGNCLETCTILTTTLNQLLADIHDRMPVILSPPHYDLWLDPGFRDVEEITAMLTPFKAGQMRRYPVSEHVNNVANDDPIVLGSNPVIAACASPPFLTAKASSTISSLKNKSTPKARSIPRCLGSAALFPAPRHRSCRRCWARWPCST